MVEGTASEDDEEAEDLLALTADDEEQENEDEAMDDDEVEEIPIKKEKSRPKHTAHHGPQPASYIMKLFDRSVNLAQFEENTPLYPLCRAWMKNQPRAMLPRIDKINDPLDVQEAQDGDVVEMPRVRIRKGKTSARSEVRINKKDFDKQGIDGKTWTKSKLLADHRAHWLEERLRHQKNARNFEEKHFAANLELLESLIKESEE